ncbi:RNA polymerase sigma factor [Rhodococcus sp. BH5]|uniref:RNA polymerase sigma factor n=1 Tax=Rhodococcus sp. BH5 TaxID=2871702 RepID=UPI0022CDA343|nr:sigma-70 family RNA polymerase sigma factor [Rhodococcus sp. BH5]
MTALINHILPLVEQLCRRIARENSADATQDAIIAIFRGVRGLQEPAAFYGWVRTVAAREAIRTAKRLKYNEVSLDFFDFCQHVNKLEMVHVSDILARLPPEHSEIIFLRTMAGMSEKEVALELSVPLGTVRSRLYRARQNFRKAWFSGN